MVADMEVHMVVDKVADMVANMEVHVVVDKVADMVADMVADIEIQFGERVGDVVG